MTDRTFDSVPEWAKLQGTTASTEKRSRPTDAQLEPIARRYCELMGEDPDEMVSIPAVPLSSPVPPIPRDALYYGGYWAGYSPAPVPRWKSVLPIVRQQAALSIAFGGSR